MIQPKNPFLIEGSAEAPFVGRKIRLEWVEQSDPDSALHEHVGNPQYLGRALSDRRLLIFFSAVALLLVTILGRVFFLNELRGGAYERIAEKNRLRVRLVVPERGLLFDVKGKRLAENVPNFVLLAIPADLPDNLEQRHQLLDRFTTFGFSAETITAWKTMIDAIPRRSLEARQPIILTDSINYDQAILFETIAEQQFGLSLALQPNRTYPLSAKIPSLGHVLGYLGRIIADEYTKLDTDAYTFADVLGRQGIEASHEAELRGKRGLDRFEVDARGIVQKLVSREPAQRGTNLRLTIDAAMQQKLEERLAAELKALHRTQGAAIALDPRDGSIRALVSIPAYDNNLFTGGISAKDYEQLRSDPSEPLFQRAISGEYPSGSTIKPVIAAAALAEGIISPTTTVLSQGGISVGIWFFPDWKKGGHGATNVYKAIAESVNTFFYIIGGGYRDIPGLGIERIVDYAKRFGLGSRLGIDLPGERPGFLPSPEWKERVKNEVWYIGDTYHAAIGQGDVLVTPLQVAAWTSVFANGGTLYRPRLVDATTDTDGNVMQKNEADLIAANVVDPTVIRVVRRALRETVLSGSARRLLDLPRTSAGKTGTAEWSSKKDTHSWFTAFAPYENPEIVVTVLIQEGGEGSRSALSVAHDFLAWYFNKKR